MSRWDYFNEITVTETSFPSSAQVDFNFHTVGFNLINQGSEIIEYSFDGTNVHGQLDASGDTVEADFISRIVNKIWFRVSSGISQVRVEGWGSSGG